LAEILIVEDDRDLAEAYDDLLTAHGHSVRLTNTVAQSMKQIAQERPDVIILDLSLPDKSGTALIRYISEQGLRDVRLIIISGHSEMLPHSHFTEVADLVLNKPISNDQLLTLLERILAASSKSHYEHPSNASVEA
jgi:DNA-binding NtrC family response regulator